MDFGDYFILGIFADSTAVGLYYFAFRLAAQTGSIVTSNAARVLFPTLLQVPSGSRRQHRSFMRAVRVLAGFGIPLAMIFVVYGADLLAALFDPQWKQAALFVQVLSIASATRTVSDSHANLLKAQGRYRELLRWNIVGTACFLAIVTLGGAVDQATGVCVAVVIHAVVGGWIVYYLTVRPFGSDFWEFGRLVSGALIASASVAIASVLFMRFTLGWTEPSAARLVLGCALMGVLYLPILHVVSPPTSRELLEVSRRVTGPVWVKVRRGVVPR